MTDRSQEKPIRLSVGEVRALQAMKDGAPLLIDHEGEGWVGDTAVASATIGYLRDEGLILKRDESRPATARDNGYVITETGRTALSETLARRRKPIPESTGPEPPTQRQLDYARDLGIDVPADATKEEVSDLISACLEKDKPATDRHRSFAVLYRVRFTRFTGKRELYQRIFNTLKRPGREAELVEWFVFRVYRTLVKGAENASINTPDDPVIKDIAAELSTQDNFLRSVQRYDPDSLLWFGEWTSPDGWQHFGGSRRTVAFQKAFDLLQQRLGISIRESESRRLSPTRGRSTKLSASPSEHKSGCATMVVIGVVIMVIYLLLTIGH